jgi:hypothetical protein
MFADAGGDSPLDADLGVVRLENALELPSPMEVAEAGCQGVSRFFDCGTYMPDQVLTCVWLPSLVVVECVSGWSRLPRAERVDQLRTRRWVSRIPTFLLPGKLRGWQRLCESLAEAPSCQGDSLLCDMLCFHSLLAGGTIVNVVWSHPHPRRQRYQAECIAAYRWLARIGRMCSLLPIQRKEEKRVGSLSWTGSLPRTAALPNYSFTALLPGSTL